MNAPMKPSLMASEAVGELDTTRMALAALAELLDCPEIPAETMPQADKLAALLWLFVERLDRVGTMLEMCLPGNDTSGSE